MARKCILCGKEYTYCPSCPKDAKKESWYAIFNNENCKNISKTLTDYNLNKISKVEARHALLECDLSIELNDHYRNEINAIIESSKCDKIIETKPVDIKQNVIIEEEPIIAIVDAKIENITEDEVIVEVKPRKAKKYTREVVLTENE